jgi:hypothetical protein
LRFFTLRGGALDLVSLRATTRLGDDRVVENLLRNLDLFRGDKGIGDGGRGRTARTSTIASPHTADDSSQTT